MYRITRLAVGGREQVVVRGRRRKVCQQICKFCLGRETPAFRANIVFDVGGWLFQACIRRDLYIGPVGIGKWAATACLVAQILGHPNVVAHADGSVGLSVAHVGQLRKVGLVRQAGESPEFDQGDAYILVELARVNVLDFNDNLEYVLERFIEHDHVGKGVFVPAPIGLGERMHLDQVVGGVLVNLDGLC